MALSWSGDTILQGTWIRYQYSIYVGDIMLNWSHAVTGSPFDHYELWNSVINQSNADTRAGDAVQIDNGDYAALGIQATKEILVLRSSGLIVNSHASLGSYWALFGYGDSSYTDPISPVSIIRHGGLIDSITQLESDETPASKGDIKVKYSIYSPGFGNIWLQYKDSNDIWQSCTRVVPSTAGNLKKTPGGYGNINYLYWLTPEIDYGEGELTDEKVRITFWK